MNIVRQNKHLWSVSRVQWFTEIFSQRIIYSVCQNIHWYTTKKHCRHSTWRRNGCSVDVIWWLSLRSSLLFIYAMYICKQKSWINKQKLNLEKNSICNTNSNNSIKKIIVLFVTHVLIVEVSGCSEAMINSRLRRD